MKYFEALLVLATACHCWARSRPLFQAPLEEESSKEQHLHLTHDLIGFHRNLTQIESITGNEGEVGDWLLASLKSQGYQTEKQNIQEDPPRFNILAWPGKTRDARVLLSSHIDTVPPFYPYKHHASTNNKTISGRGSVDAKGSVATQIIAINSLLSSGKIHPDHVAVLFVVGEETGGDGMRAANALRLRPQTVIFGEPTEGKLVSGHKGRVAFTIHAKGRASHSGYPWLGRSANEVLVKALTALMDLGTSLPESDKYGSTTINIGKLEGGVASNVVAESASANITVRIADGTPKFVEGEVTKAINTAVESFLEDGMKSEDVVELKFQSSSYAPVDIDADIDGFDVITVNYGTDIPNLNKTVKGQKRYLYGPGSILVAHSDHEAITEDQLWDAVGGYQKIVLHALKHD